MKLPRNKFITVGEANARVERLVEIMREECDSLDFGDADVNAHARQILDERINHLLGNYHVPMPHQEATNTELFRRITDLEEIVVRLGILPPAVAESTITPKEAAHELGVSVARVSQLIKSGKLRATRVGGRVRIDSQSVLGFKS